MSMSCSEKKIDSQSRKFHVVINNPLEKNFDHGRIQEVLQGFRGLRYACFADEIGETGTFHTHIYVLLKNPTRHSTMRRAFNNQAHIEVAKGTSQENRAYIAKEGKWKLSAKQNTSLGTFEEIGSCPDEQPGRRTDLFDMYELLKAGATDYEVLETNPNLIRYIGHMEKVRYALAKENSRTAFRNVSVSYYYGGNGTGRRSQIYAAHNADDIYRVNEYKNPFDNYNNQPVLCLDGYKECFPLKELLSYLEGFPMTQLRARYSNKYANYTQVYIVSTCPLGEQYKADQFNDPDDWHALLRHIDDVCEFLPDGKKRRFTITDDYLIVPDDGNNQLGSGHFGNLQ